MIRRVLAYVVLPVALAHAWAATFTGCNVLSPADEAHVATDSIQMSTCAASAHLCKVAQSDANYAPCWQEFDDCMAAHGFADAGKEGGDR